MSDWEAGADLLEALLERAGRLVDGEDPDTSPIDSISRLDLSSTPDPVTLDRILSLLDQVPAASASIATVTASLQDDLDHLDRHRSAATAYVRSDT